MALSEIKLVLAVDGAGNVTGALKDIEGATNSLSSTTRSATSAMEVSWQKLAGTFAAGNLIARGIESILALIGRIPDAINSAINAIDSLKVSTIQIAAQITTMQGPKNVAEHYAQASKYAETLATKLQEVDAKSFANYQTLLLMTQTMTLQGVVLDVNNKKQVDAFTALSNAVAMYTAGQNQSVQAHQEIRSLMSGEVTQGSQLAIQIDQLAKNSGLYKGGLKEIVAEGKKHGDTLERLAPFLVGINAASGDIEKTWQAVTSSAATAYNMIQRIGFREFFQEIVKLGGESVSWLKAHAEIIGGGIARGWLTVRGLLETITILFNDQDGALRGIGGAAKFILSTVNDILYGWAFLVSTVLPTVAEKFNSIINILNALVNMAYMFGTILVDGVIAAAKAIASMGSAFMALVTGDLAGAQRHISEIFGSQFKAIMADDVTIVKGTVAAIKEEWGKLNDTSSFNNRFDSFTGRQKKTESVTAPVLPPPPPGGEKGKLTAQQKEYQQQIKEFLKTTWDMAALELAREDFSSDITKKLGLLTPKPAGFTKNPAMSLGVDIQLQSLEQQAAANKKLAEAEAARLAVETELLRIQKEVDKLDRDTARLRTDLIDDPYEQQKQDVIDRYEAERKQVELTMRAHKDSQAIQEAGTKKLTALEEKRIKETKGLDEQSFKSRLSVASQYTGMAGQMFTALAQTQDQTSRSGFESAKAFSLAAAVMNTAAAIMNALATVPYPMSIAAAALAGVTGALQIATIASTTFGGGGSVAAVPSGAFGGGSGGATGSGGGAGVNAPYATIQQSRTAAELDAIAKSMDNAALALGRAADTFLNIGEMFKSSIIEMLMQIAPGKYTPTPADMSGFATNAINFLNLDKKSMTAAFRMDVGALWNQTMAGLFGGDAQVSGAGITGEVKAGKFNTGSYTQYHKNGGLFGASWDSTSYGNNVDHAFAQGMDQFFSGLRNDILTGAAAFGLSAQATQAGFANANMPRMQVATAGRSAEDIQKDWEVVMQSAADALAKTVPGLEALSLGGEHAADTFKRLSSAIMNSNDNLALIGARLIPVTGQISDAAYNLETLLGGADAFLQKTQDYLGAMFTDTEQAARKAAQAQRQVNTAFAEMGLAAPATKAGFRALIDSLDLSSESGVRLFAALMDVSGAFAAVQDQAAQVSEATRAYSNDLTTRELALAGINSDLFTLRIQQADEMKKAIDDGMDTTRLAIVQQAEWAAAIAKATGVVTQSLKDIANAAKTSALSMVDAQIAIANSMKTIMTGPLAGLSPEAAYNQAQAKFAALQGKTDLASVQALPQAATDLLNASKAYNASGTAYQTDLAKVLEAMNLAIGGSGDPTLDTIETQLKVLQDIRTALTDGVLVKELGANGTLAILIGKWNDATAAELAAQQKLAADQTYQRDLTAYTTAQQAFVSGAGTVADLEKTIAPLASDYATSIAAGNIYPTPPITAISSIDIDTRMKLKAAEIVPLLAYLREPSATPYPYDPKLDIGYYSGDLHKFGGDGVISSADWLGWVNIANGTVPYSRMGIPAFAGGGIAYSASIFGEAGPEAAVPLPDGRRIPVMLSGSADNRETVAELKEQNALLRELLSEAKAGVRVAQAVGTEQIAISRRQERNGASLANTSRLAVNA